MLVFSGDILGLHVVEGVFRAESGLLVLIDIDKQIDERVELVLTQLQD